MLVKAISWRTVTLMFYKVQAQKEPVLWPVDCLLVELSKMLTHPIRGRNDQKDK
jgi:hypothetical protein